MKLKKLTNHNLLNENSKNNYKIEENKINKVQAFVKNELDSQNIYINK